LILTVLKMLSTENSTTIELMETEESSPAAEVVDPPRFETIVRHISPFLSAKEFYALRLTERSINNFLPISPQFQKKIQFHINGYKLIRFQESFVKEPFLSLLQNKSGWSSIKFTFMNLEKLFFGIEEHFNQFVTQNCHTLRS